MLENARNRLDAAVRHVQSAHPSYPPELQVRLVEALLVDARSQDRAAKGVPEKAEIVPELEPVKSGPLVNALKDWRRRTARDTGRAPHHVLFNETLWALATLQPATMEELQRVKGIKEGKATAYGADLLKIIAEHTETKTTASLLPKDRPLRLGPIATAILDTLENRPLASLPLITAVAGQTGQSETAVETSINKLAEAGKIRTDKRGRYRLVKIDS